MQALRQLGRRALPAAARSLHASAGRLREAAAEEVIGSENAKKFIEAFVARAPSTMTAPNFPPDFSARPLGEVGVGRPGGWMQGLSTPAAPSQTVKKTVVPTTIPDKVTLNFYLPHSIEFQNQKVTELN